MITITELAGKLKSLRINEEKNILICKYIVNKIGSKNTNV